jgi:hypothetical protein
MAAVAPLRHDHDDSRRSVALSLVPPLPRSRRSQHRRDAVYAVTLAVLLGVGILGVLLLNTAMQTQADRIAATKQQLADLTLRAQVLQTAADETDSPAVLAARARSLHLRPATRVAIVALAKPGSEPAAKRARRPSVSERAREAHRGRAG